MTMEARLDRRHCPPAPESEIQHVSTYSYTPTTFEGYWRAPVLAMGLVRQYRTASCYNEHSTGLGIWVRDPRGQNAMFVEAEARRCRGVSQLLGEVVFKRGTLHRVTLGQCEACVPDCFHSRHHARALANRDYSRVRSCKAGQWNGVDRQGIHTRVVPPHIRRHCLYMLGLNLFPQSLATVSRV